MTFSSYTLDNGMKILTYQIPSLQSITINLTINVGSRNEKKNEFGISHFIEHMLFKGTKKRSAKKIAEEFDFIGGHFNACTSNEQTIFYIKVLREYVYKALEILSDIIQNSTFYDEDIFKEYEVILQEIRAIHDTPEDLVFENLLKTAYKNQPLGHSILGTKKTLKTFNQILLKEYLTNHYHANNMVLSITGNIKNKNLLFKITKLFENISFKKLKTSKKSCYKGGYKFVKRKLEQTNIILAFESVNYRNLYEVYKTQILSVILGDGASSRLFQKIRENSALVYSINTYNYYFSDSGLFYIIAATSSDKVITLLKKLIEEINQVINFIDESELIRAKNQIKSNICIASEDPNYLLEEMTKNFTIFNRYISSKEIIEQINSIKLQEIKEVANKIFKTKPTFSGIGCKNPILDWNNLITKIRTY